MGESSTSFFQLASVTVTGRRGKIFSLQRPQVGSSPRRARKTRFRLPHALQAVTTDGWSSFTRRL
jgi:hypothetical protein